MSLKIQDNSDLKFFQSFKIEINFTQTLGTRMKRKRSLKLVKNKSV